MEIKYTMDVLKSLTSGIAQMMGSDTETVLHDLRANRIIQIENGHVTGRTIGNQIDPTIYDTILALVDEKGHAIGYNSHNHSGKKLRSSHFVFYDEAHEPFALLCVNQDTSKLEQLRNALDLVLNDVSGQQLQPVEEDTIKASLQRIIIQCIERMKPVSLDTKNAKLEIIQELEQKGVFSVKDSVPMVCRMLSISQATLYNYLRQLRSQDSPLPELPL